MIVRLDIASSVGVSLTGLTVTSNVRVNLALSLVVERSPSSPASSTVTEIVAAPEASATGVNVSVPVALGDVYVAVGLGIKAVSLLSAVTFSSWVSPLPAEIPDRFTVC